MQVVHSRASKERRSPEAFGTLQLLSVLPRSAKGFMSHIVVESANRPHGSTFEACQRLLVCEDYKSPHRSYNLPSSWRRINRLTGDATWKRADGVAARSRSTDTVRMPSEALSVVLVLMLMTTIDNYSKKYSSPRPSHRVHESVTSPILWFSACASCPL